MKKKYNENNYVTGRTVNKKTSTQKETWICETVVSKFTLDASSLKIRYVSAETYSKTQKNADGDVVICIG